jgi:holin-like protein
MLGWLTIIFMCQLIGEAAVVAFGLPIPGPVVGMALLFAGLVGRGAIPDDLATVGDGLVGHLSLLFVPAGVGVMLHADLLRRDGVAIGIALIASTLLAIAVTAVVMARLAPREDR